ncbi:MAG: archease [Chloroflexi bacterium]|nr:archease [Chloroflexota bacterium]
MKKYRLIEHTADIGIVAYGRTLAEAFGNAGYGLFAIITDMRRVRAIEPRTVEIREKDADSLLFEWLNNLIYLFDVERMLFKKFDIREFNGQLLKATCYGEKYDPARHHLKLSVKSATYHMLTVDKKNNQVRVIFDV